MAQEPRSHLHLLLLRFPLLPHPPHPLPHSK